MTLLEIRDIKKYFSQGGYIENLVAQQEAVKAVDGVSLTLERDETVSIVGESGCGKSTVAKTVMGLFEPTEGEILFEGEPLTAKNVGRKPISMIFQNAGESLNPRKTVGRTLAKPLAISGVEDIETEIDDLLSQVGLDPDMKDRYPNSFSGGQKQRIAIARALASKPDVLIADEPVSGLDVSIQGKIINLLNVLKSQRDFSLIVISHNLGVVRAISDKINIMYLGKIVERGRTEDVFENPAHPYTEALLSAVPQPDPNSSDERIILSGEPPDPRNPPAGCSFHPRCPRYIGEICENAESELLESGTQGRATGMDHEAKCHLLKEEYLDG